MKNNEMTDAEKRAWLDEVNHPDKVFLVCNTHGYAPGSKTGIFAPVMGCEGCAEVDIRYRLAKLPPHQRAQYLNDMHEFLRNMDQAIEKQNFSLDIWDKPIVQTLKDSN